MDERETRTKGHLRVRHTRVFRLLSSFWRCFWVRRRSNHGATRHLQSKASNPSRSGVSAIPTLGDVRFLDNENHGEHAGGL